MDFSAETVSGLVMLFQSAREVRKLESNLPSFLTRRKDFTRRGEEQREAAHVTSAQTEFTSDNFYILLVYSSSTCIVVGVL